MTTNQLEIKPGEADYLLGLMYYNGEIAESNRKKAFKYFKKAAAFNHIEAHHMLAKMYGSTSVKKHVEHLVCAHKLGCLKATQRLAVGFYRGRSYLQSLEYLNHLYAFGVSDQGINEYFLAELLFNVLTNSYGKFHQKVTCNVGLDFVINLLDSASQKGYKEATRWLASLFQKGFTHEEVEPIEKDLYRAIQILKRQESDFYATINFWQTEWLKDYNKKSKKE